MLQADETSNPAVANNATGLSQNTIDGKARAQALASLQTQSVTTTSVIEYTSAGRLVIIGSGETAVTVVAQLLEHVNAVAIIDPTEQQKPPAIDDRVFYIKAQVAQVSGHLGDFDIQLQQRAGESLSLKRILGRRWTQIDLVLDLCETPYSDAQLPPPGYFVTHGNLAKLPGVIAAIPDLIGEFDKPRYFHYNPDICAHARNGKTACTRCIDACPTLAIKSIGEQVQVDPYLCQGGGSCAAVCPSGAMQYVYPGLANGLSRIRQLLKTYHQAQGQSARVVFHEAAHSETLQQLLTGLDEDLIPLAWDELGAIDLAMLLNTLVYGAQQIIIATSEDTPARVRDTLLGQQTLARAFLQGLGYAAERIMIAPLPTLATVALPAEQTLPRGVYASFDDKRTMIRLALEHLHHHALLQPATLALADGAPFGEIQVNPQTCTLCLACTGVCPTAALATGSESPQLKFIEDQCVQCGLCEQTCPEQAITRTARYLFDSEQRRARRVLHEEPAFHCVQCGKPFATRKVIEHMQTKLSGHWMFGSDRAMRRLQMCEDCRVADLWDEQNA